MLLRICIALLAVSTLAPADAVAQPPVGPVTGVGGTKARKPRAKVFEKRVTVISGAGDASVMRRYLRRQRNRLRHCAEREYARGWTAAGQIDFEVNANGDGAMSAVTVLARTMPERSGLEKCLARMIGRIVIPSGSGVVVYHLRLVIESPKGIPKTATSVAPDPTESQANSAKALAREAVQRGRCLTRAGKKLARLARKSLRSSAKRRLRLAPKIAAAQAELSACETGLGLLRGLGNETVQLGVGVP